MKTRQIYTRRGPRKWTVHRRLYARQELEVLRVAHFCGRLYACGDIRTLLKPVSEMFLECANCQLAFDHYLLVLRLGALQHTCIF